MLERAEKSLVTRGIELRGSRSPLLKEIYFFAVSNLTESEEMGTPCFHVGLYDL
jgi:hypothetical protein